MLKKSLKNIKNIHKSVYKHKLCFSYTFHVKKRKKLESCRLLHLTYFINIFYIFVIYIYIIINTVTYKHSPPFTW